MKTSATQEQQSPAQDDGAALRDRLGLITADQLYNMLGIGRGTAANRQSAGKLPAHYKVGAKKFYELGEVQAWMRRQCKGGPR